MGDNYGYEKFYDWAKKRCEEPDRLLNPVDLECFYEDFSEYLTSDDDLISNLVSGESIYCKNIDLDEFIPDKGYIVSKKYPWLFLMFLNDTGFEVVDSVDIFESMIQI
jgi:hypothetical protein